MTIFLIMLFKFWWYVVGVLSTLYWLSKNWDVKAVDMPFVFVMALAGPIAFIIGWIADGEPIIKGNVNKIIVKRRKK